MDHAQPEPIGAAATQRHPMAAPEHRQYTRRSTQMSGRPGMSEAEHYSVDDLSDSAEEIKAKLEAGDELVLDSGGWPLAKVTPLRHPQRERIFGAWKGKVWVSDDFDEPDEEIERLFGMRD